MRELVASNELEGHMIDISCSLRTSFTSLHQLAGECGVTTTIPAHPDEFSLTSSLTELATVMEEIPSKHAARIDEETSNGIYTGACHFLACMRLAHPDLDLKGALDRGAPMTRARLRWKKSVTWGSPSSPFLKSRIFVSLVPLNLHAVKLFCGSKLLLSEQLSPLFP
jgi:hypothetical protein